MGFFDSVASTVFNTATSAYNTVVRPVTTAASSVVRTVSQPIVQGSYSTGATEQVSVQPKPPIVTAVSNRPVTPSPGTTVTPQTTPSGKQVYVTSRPSPVQPDPVTVTRPVQIQAPSAAQLIGSLAPGGALVGAAQLISGDQNVLRNVVMDLPGTGTFTGTPTLAGYRETAIKQQQIAAQTRIQQQEQAIAGFKQEVAQRKTLQEQAILGYNQREQALRREVTEFNALGPATSIEEYNSRLSTANLLNTKIQVLQAEGSQINADILAGNRNLYKKQIGLLNESDAINRDLVNLNVESANLGTTGIGGLTLGFEERVNKPISNIALTEIGKPFGMTKEDVALGLQLNRMASESMVTYGGPSTFNLGTAYGAGMLQDTLMKPGEAIVWTGVGIATGGVTRALAPGMEAAVAASRVPGASLGARALGTGIRAAPYVMGAAFAGQVGFETGFESTPTGLKIRSPGGMVSRLGGLTATEIAPMIGGGIVGYNAPEIGQAAYRGIRTGELRFRRFGESLGEEGMLGPSERQPPKETPQEYIFREKPVIDLTKISEEMIVLNEPKNVVATPFERRMIIEQYGITEKEMSYLQQTGTSLNDLLGLRQQFRSPKPEIMIIPEEGLPDLRTDWDIFPITKTQPLLKSQQLESVFTLQEAKQISDLQYFGMEGTLLKPGQKVMVDAKLTNLSMGGVKPLSTEDISIALGTSTLLKPLTQQGVSTKQQQKQDQILMAGLFSGVGLTDLQAQSQRPVSIQGSRITPVSLNLQDVALQQISLQEPIFDTQLRTQVIQIPEVGLTPITTVLQVPDITTKLIQQQINITTPEIPPYTPPPEHTFEIPPIPPPIIPGFPMGLGGGGGGGGYGGDRGGYLFEETLKGGGESDPFGIGGMNFDALGMMGIPKGTGSGKRRRRRK